MQFILSRPQDAPRPSQPVWKALGQLQEALQTGAGNPSLFLAASQCHIPVKGTQSMTAARASPHIVEGSRPPRCSGHGPAVLEGQCLAPPFGYLTVRM